MRDDCKIFLADISWLPKRDMHLPIDCSDQEANETDESPMPAIADTVLEKRPPSWVDIDRTTRLFRPDERFGQRSREEISACARARVERISSGFWKKAVDRGELLVASPPRLTDCWPMVARTEDD
jgi:hypothetical protein